MKISRTNVGSHMWGMERPDSDVDLFDIYLAHTKEILLGHAPHSECKKGAIIIGGVERPCDIVRHELGKTVQMILDNNVNFVWGVFSPIVETTTPIFEELKKFGRQCLGKDIYHSIRGMSKHNIRHLGMEGMTEKKARTIIRTIDFGIDFLTKDEIQFRKCNCPLPSDYKQLIAFIDGKLFDLEMAYDKANFVDYEHRKNLEEWLVGVRLEHGFYKVVE